MGLNYIDGRWVAAQSGATFERRNPADRSDVIGTFPDSGHDDVEIAVSALIKSAPAWAATAPERRAEILEAAAANLESNAAALVDELVREEGKTRAEATMEVGRTPMNLRFYAAEAVRTTGTTYPSPGEGLVFTVREPVGVVGAITPWNFPLNIPSRKIGPALAAGNVLLLKPSELTPLMGQRLVEALLAGGLPPGVIALVQGSGKAGAAVVADSRVDAITFTGSTQTGRAIHAAVGPERRSQLEMGGKNPVVVLEGADLDKAASLIVKGAFGLSGQACTGTSRVVAVDAIHDDLLSRVVVLAQKLVVGAGGDEGVTMGALASAGQYRKFLDYVQVGLDDGAELICGGTPHDDNADGFFVTPTVFSGGTPEMRIVTEEVFGPLLVFLRTENFDSAVDLANNTEYGLSSSVVTNDIATALAFAARTKTGLVKINQPTTGMSMNAPFGGFKASSTQTNKEQAGESMMGFYQCEKTIYLSGLA
ncbi:aldehyde dehydrogenase [Rhodococcus sp. AD45-ID]|uniref:aldehyde dehydrogenase family protein n=1 Tax=unclassified Rhodococcus (in: high G+C Gram-positive bacteria) TaxID=192944 RepID=UPI0005D3D74F|nr:MULTISPECIES: aldehyde dehydrogenase family protein [unclassified Rhodococcus (in: high G+C Gram-positive bacteria)]KJF24818.1 Aldehyde dehydrogenase, thermostable [Rhodococcus sp. AD45]PSR43066.1 aldehyde dehydrogenase [Rhodococcus sp. AD45-ID]